jgi:dolichyl-phosphate-mannose-protein mannosyltransferase
MSVPSSAAPLPPAPPIEPIVEQQQQQQPIAAKNDEMISEMISEQPVVSKEERIEYRDENGRVLNDDEVSALAGKVSFKTRYETRTRIVDAQGNEIYEGLVDAHGAEEQAGVAPPHPDVEGGEPETQQGSEPAEASDAPPTVEVVEDQQKESSVEQDSHEAKPE